MSAQEPASRHKRLKPILPLDSAAVRRCHSWRRQRGCTTARHIARPG